MNFYIMSKDIAVAKWHDNSLEILNEKLYSIINSSEKMLIYDLINDKFYANDGTGQFTKGPNV